MFIPMLHGLQQADRLWNPQARTPPFAGPHGLTIRLLQKMAVAVPPIAEPVQFSLVRALDSGADGLFNQFLTQRTSGAGYHETTVAVLYQASPTFSRVRLLSC